MNTEHRIRKLEEQMKLMEERHWKEVRRFDHLYAVVQDLDLNPNQRARLNKAWWGSADE